MKINRRTVSTYSLILGMAFLVLGITTDNKVFSVAAVAFILVFLLASGKWMRKRR